MTITAPAPATEADDDDGSCDIPLKILGEKALAPVNVPRFSPFEKLLAILVPWRGGQPGGYGYDAVVEVVVVAVVTLRGRR
jgi:hypothetical protein